MSLKKSFGLYDKGDKVVLKLEWPDDSEEAFAKLCPQKTVGDNYTPTDSGSGFRYAEGGMEPLYLPGTILCKKLIRDRGVSKVSYCVHVPPNECQTLLELGRTTKDSPLAPKCLKHPFPEGMLCGRCLGEPISVGNVKEIKESARDFMLAAGYVCTIRVVE